MELVSFERSPLSAPDTVCVGTVQQFQVQTDPPGHYDAIDINQADCSVIYNLGTGLVTVTFDRGTANAEVTASCAATQFTISTVVVDPGSIGGCRKIGVGSSVSLTVNPTPPGRVFNWYGNGVFQTAGNTLTFTAPNEDGSAEIKACDSDPPVQDCCAIDTFNVVGECEPNSDVIPDHGRLAGAAQGGCNSGEKSFLNVFDPPESEMTACYYNSANEWHIRAEVIIIRYDFKFCNAGKTDIFQANDPHITSANYCTVIQDITPDGNGIPPYNTYYPQECESVTCIEGVLEFEELFDDEWLSTEPLIEALAPVPFICGSTDTPSGAVAFRQADIDSLVQAASTRAFQRWGYNPGQFTQRMLDRRVACLQELIADIRARFPPPNPSCP